MSSHRQCYVCALPVPSEDVVGWEVIKLELTTQYRCPKHRVMSPKQLATIGDKVKLNQKYGRFGK